MSQRTSLVATSPAEHIAEELTAREWSVEVFATRSGLSITFVLQLLDGVVVIDEALAQAIAKAFGTSSQLWLNLQRSYDDARALASNEWHNALGNPPTEGTTVRVRTESVAYYAGGKWFSVGYGNLELEHEPTEWRELQFPGQALKVKP